MRFLVINTDYTAFLQWLYGTHSGLSRESYERQLAVHAESAFGVAAIYAKYLRRLGHRAVEVHANNPFAQMAWARENGLGLPLWRRWGVGLRKGVMPWPRRSAEWMDDVLAVQIESFVPDVVVNLDVRAFGSSFFAPIKSHLRLLVGQHAATALPGSSDWDAYDLMISSFPPTVDWFRRRGVVAEPHSLGFDPEVRGLVDQPERDVPVSFVGSFSGVHRSRLEFLDTVCGMADVAIWGPESGAIDGYSRVREAHMGPAWGLDMYRALARSKITLNHHGDVAPFANNFRLYEATGMGAMLITDWKPDLEQKFAERQEVAAYRTAEECVEIIRYYLESDAEREDIARAGERRTLRDHNYSERMRELTEIVARYL